MTARAISAQLVDIRNVGTHKCVKLTIHAPEEQALRIMELFGWPTGAAPVPVALARLNDAAAEQPPRQDNQSVASSVPAGVDKPHKSPAQIAGYLCTTGSFQQFLRERLPSQWANAIRFHRTHPELDDAPDNLAAETVRDYCKVDSRAEITKDNADWSALLLAYRLWEKEAEVVPA